MTETRSERIAATALALTFVLVAGAVAWYGRSAVPGRGVPGAVVVNLTGVGASGVWTLQEVNGLNYWWKTFAPATIHLRVGDEVVLNLRSADLFHSFYAPGLGVGPVEVEPGHLRTVRFRAERAGVYQYYCTSMCGTCHFFMRGWIVVTAPGEEPIHPPPILCQQCQVDESLAGGGTALIQAGEVVEPRDLLRRGALLYLQRGCVTCHGPDGRGGVPNPNSTIKEPPAHDTTAQKLFLASEEDARAFVRLVAAEPELADPESLREATEIQRFPVVRTRFLNAKEIVRLGRYTAKLDPAGPEPPLQMPAWQYLLEEREIDALLAYFVSLQDWEEESWGGS